MITRLMSLIATIALITSTTVAMERDERNNSPALMSSGNKAPNEIWCMIGLTAGLNELRDPCLLVQTLIRLSQVDRKLSFIFTYQAIADMVLEHSQKCASAGRLLVRSARFLDALLTAMKTKTRRVSFASMSDLTNSFWCSLCQDFNGCDERKDKTSSFLENCSVGNEECVQVFLKHGVNLTLCDEEQRTALQLATKCERPQVFLILLPHITNRRDIETCLFSLLQDEKTAFFKAVIEGSNFDAATLDQFQYPDDERKQSLMAMAAQKDLDEVIEFLHTRGCSIETADQQFGYRPLMYAANYGNKKAAQKLVDLKADVNAQCKNNQRALWYSIKGKNPQKVVSTLLLTAGSNFEADLFDALQFKKVDEFKKLIEHLNLNAAYLDGIRETKDKKRPLMAFAAEQNLPEVIDYLHRIGCSLEIADHDNGFRPLMRAAYFGRTEAVRKLVELKAEINATSHTSQTALGFAQHAEQTAVVTVLTEAGGKI